MVGGSRNGRAVKLALLVGLVLLTLYFLVSWKREAQTLTSNLALAEKEYEAVIKRYNRLEKELKEKVELEAKCSEDRQAKKDKISVLEEDKVELKEQIAALNADRDAKSQEAQRLKEELRDAKDAAADEYEALSASCAQNQQTCEKRAKEAENSLVNLRAESATNHQSLLDCDAKLSVQQEVASSCNARLSSLEKEGANRLSEIEQMQSQLRKAQQDNTHLVAQVHELHKSDGGQPHPAQPGEEEGLELRHDVVRRYSRDNAGMEKRGYHGDEIGQRSQRDSIPGAGMGNGMQRHNWRYPVEDVGMKQDNHAVKDDLRYQRQVDFREDNHANAGLDHQREELGGAKQPESMDHIIPRKTGVGRDSFSDIKLSDEQKWNVFESLLGKLSRGERLDSRQQRIYQLLLKDFSSDDNPAGVGAKNAAKDVPLRNAVDRKEEVHQEQEEGEDGVRMGGKREDQLPNPLDGGEEEVKDLIEAQKPGEFDNLGGGGQADKEEPIGGGGEKLDGGKEEEDEEENYYEGERREGGKDDNPLPRPGQEENPDDEDNGANGDKADNDEDNQVEDIQDMYGEQAYKQDKEQFKQERLQKNFDRQL